MRNLTRDSSLVFFSNLARLFFSLAAGFITARMLGPEGKGQIVLMLQIAAFGANILSLGLGPSYQYYLKNGAYTRDALASHMLVQIILTCIVLALVAFWGMAPLRTVTDGHLNDWLIKISLALLGLTVISSYINFTLMGLSEGVKQSSIYNFIGDGLYIVLLFALVWIFKMGVSGAVFAYGVGMVAKIVLASRIVFKSTKPYFTFPWLNLSKTLSIYGLSSMVGQLMYTSVMRIDIFLVNIYLGATGVGIYSVAVSVAELVLLLPSAIGIALFPHLTAGSSAERLLTTGKVARLSLLIGLGGISGLILFGYPFIYLVFGMRFLSAYCALLWLLPGVLSMTLNYAYANFFSSCGQPHFNAILYALAVFINVIVNLQLIPLWGINGASVASSITYSIVTLAFIILISKKQLLDWKELVIPQKSDCTFLIFRLRNMLPAV